MPTMPSRPGLSIRKKLCPPRDHDDTLGSSWEHEDLFQPAPPTKKDPPAHARKDSWFATHRRSSSAKRPPPIMLGASPSIHDIKSLPPLPDEGPRSSPALSICSVERREAKADSKRSVSPCSLDSTKDDQSEPFPQLASATNLDIQACSPPAPDMSPRTDVISKKYQDIPGTSCSEPPPERPLSSGLSDENKEESPALRNQSSFQDFTDNVKHLIREADEAFKAIDNTLTEVRLSQESLEEQFSKSFASNSELPNSFNMTRPLSVISLASSSGELTRPRSKTQPPGSAAGRNSVGGPAGFRRNSIQPSPVTRSKSQKKLQEQKKKAHRKAAAAKHLSKQSPRWPLAENMTELFSGRLFQKLEVDEVLTPDQLEAFRQQRRMSEDQRTASPGHSRNGSAESVDILGGDPSLFSSRKGSIASVQSEARSSLDTPTETQTAPASPPTDSQARHQPHALPSIPEDSNVSEDSEEGEDSEVDSDSIHETQSTNSCDDFVFLRATPCTMTMPSFRHGSIRLNKSDLCPDPIVGADDGLDWTAFQMAILGGAGDWNTDSDDDIRRREAEEAADVVDWWCGWDLNNAEESGEEEDFVPGSPTSTLSGDEDDFSYRDITHENPYIQKEQWEQMRRDAAAEVRPLTLTSANSCKPSRFGMDGQQTDAYPTVLPPMKASNGQGFTAIPSNQMLDFPVFHGHSAEEAEVVPMGYNLGSDLGDYLKWESDHTYAGALYATGVA